MLYGYVVGKDLMGNSEAGSRKRGALMGGGSGSLFGSLGGLLGLVRLFVCSFCRFCMCLFVCGYVL
jgi:preprotein translocase subunit SecG